MSRKGQLMRVSLIQMNPQGDKMHNLIEAKRLIDQTVKADKPDLIILPEMWMLLTEEHAVKVEASESFPHGEAYELLRGLAIRHKVAIHGGSLLEKAGDKFFNTTVVFDAKGKELARYRKIHLFDVMTPDGRLYRESATFERGSDIVTYKLKGRTIGCTICYDLRFPELFQKLQQAGADIIVVPAAFTLQTGKDHWEVLLRARAIETETYVLAAGACGSFSNGSRQLYGHSLVVDPWGHVTARASDGPGVVSTRLDFDYLAKVRSLIPVAQHKVL